MSKNHASEKMEAIKLKIEHTQSCAHLHTYPQKYTHNHKYAHARISTYIQKDINLCFYLNYFSCENPMALHKAILCLSAFISFFHCWRFFFFSLYSYFQNCIFISNLLVFVYYLFLLRNFDFHSLLNSAFLYKSTSLFSLSIYLSYQFLFLKFILIFFSLSSVLLFIV